MDREKSSVRSGTVSMKNQEVFEDLTGGELRELHLPNLS